MKNKQIISPIGLKGNQIHERQLSLMGIKPITENENKGNHAVELTKIGPDGNAYAIIRENHEYFIKRTNKTTGLVLEDFKYIGGLQNKKDEAYPSYAKAIKQLNLKFKSLSESYNRGGDINVFEDDNLLEHHPLKADQALSATKGIGDNEEYIVDKKGTPLSNKAKEGKEEGQFGDNVADKKVADEFEKVNESFGMGFTGEGNLEGNKPMVDEVELNEFEQAIEEMMARYDESSEDDTIKSAIESTVGDKVEKTGEGPNGDAIYTSNLNNNIQYFVGPNNSIVKLDKTTGQESVMGHLDETKFPDLTGDGKVTQADILKGRGVDLDEKFPDLTGDGEVTQADILKGRGVFEEEDEYVDYTMGNEDDPNQLPNPPRELNISVESIEESIKRLDALLEGELKKKALK